MHTAPSGRGASTPPAPRQLRWPDDDGVIGNVSWPYTSERHAGLHWSHALIVVGVVLMTAGGLLWWLA